MINTLPIRTEKGLYKAVNCGIENGRVYYAIEFRANGEKCGRDVGTFQVYTDGVASGSSPEYNVSFVEVDEETIFPAMVEEIDKNESLPVHLRNYSM